MKKSYSSLISIVLTFLLISCGNSKTPDLNKDHIGFDRIISEVNSKEAISPDREGLNRLVKIVDFSPKNIFELLRTFKPLSFISTGKFGNSMILFLSITI